MLGYFKKSRFYVDYTERVGRLMQVLLRVRSLKRLQNLPIDLVVFCDGCCCVQAKRRMRSPRPQ
jgi:hypothetical protein